MPPRHLSTVRTRTNTALLAGAVALLSLLVLAGTGHAAGKHLKLRFLGEATFPTGFQFQDTEVGGLSGIDYDRRRQIYYAISDDRSDKNPARFYTLSIDLGDGSLEDGDVVFQDVVTILDRDGTPFELNEVDPESIRYHRRRHSLFWTSEGDANALLPPFVREMTLDGGFLRELQTPSKYDPVADGSRGIRNNLAFENLTRQGYNRLLTATENALAQDGPAASLTEGSPSRVLQLEARNGTPRREYIYITEPIPNPATPPDAFKTNGLVEILAYGHTSFLALERGFSVGAGNTIKLFLADYRHATNVRQLDSIEGRRIRPIEKRLVLDFDELGITLDNVEGITYGPRLPSGDRTLILVSDNNFNANGQFTQFLAFAIEHKRDGDENEED